MVPLIEMQKVTKRFGSLTANDQVDFTCYPGEVVSLLGENGAGKTTLMNTLYGIQSLDGGQILYKGEPVEISSPKDAISLGIQMVHQHFMLIPTLTVSDNIMLGKEKAHFFLTQTKQANEEVRELSAEYGLKVNPEDFIKDLSVGGQQRVEIIKALYRGAELLILDEPTAVLTPQEIDELFATVEKLRRSGKSIIIITHKLKETMAISDRVYILRNGKMVGVRNTKETSPEELTELMVGHRISPITREKHKTGELALQTEKLSYKDQMGVERLSDAQLNVYCGEIYGIAGVEGNGQKELIDVLAGIEKNWEGDIRLFGKPIKGMTTREILDSGVAFVHADRHSRGLMLGKVMPKNLLLGSQRKSGFYSGRAIKLLNWEKINSFAEALMAEFDVRPDNLDLNARDFSGGNQQKAVIAREFSRGAKLLVISNPTRGVDISAADLIHKKMLEMRDKGVAILLISADLDEIMEMSDRIGVIYEGRIAAEREAGAFTEKEIGKYMGGNAS